MIYIGKTDDEKLLTKKCVKKTKGVIYIRRRV